MAIATIVLIPIALLAAVECAYTVHLRKQRTRATGERIKLLATNQRQVTINLELARRAHQLEGKLTDAVTDAAHWHERYEERCKHVDSD